MVDYRRYIIDVILYTVKIRFKLYKTKAIRKGVTMLKTTNKPQPKIKLTKVDFYNMYLRWLYVISHICFIYLTARLVICCLTTIANL